MQALAIGGLCALAGAVSVVTAAVPAESGLSALIAAYKADFLGMTGKPQWEVALQIDQKI